MQQQHYGSSINKPLVAGSHSPSSHAMTSGPGDVAPPPLERYSSTENSPRRRPVALPHSDSVVRAPVRDWLRRACMSKTCFLLQVAFNLLLVLLNTFLIGYDVYFAFWLDRPGQTTTELWFVVLDISVVAVLLVEVLFLFWLENDCRCSRYCSTPQNKFDLAVALFSLLALGAYVYERLYDTTSGDSETVMLALRIARDIVRLTRLIYFLKDFWQSVVDFQHFERGYEDMPDGHDHHGGHIAHGHIASGRVPRSGGLPSPSLRAAFLRQRSMEQDLAAHDEEDPGDQLFHDESWEVLTHSDAKPAPRSISKSNTFMYGSASGPFQLPPSMED